MPLTEKFYVQVLKSFGLRMDDPRLRPMMHKLKQIEKQQEAKFSETMEPKHWRLDKEQFMEYDHHFLQRRSSQKI